MPSTITTTDFDDSSIKPGNIVVIHCSEPTSPWQKRKLRNQYKWWFRWYVLLFPVRYRYWEEEAPILQINNGTTLTIGMKTIRRK